VRLDRARIEAPGPLRVALDDPGRWRSIDLRSRALPLEVSGRVLGGLPGQRRTIAVAVGGRVCGVQRSYALRGRESFALVVPDGCLAQGRNGVRVFAVGHGGRSPWLTPLPPG
jgi:hypothetical protein